MHTSVSRNTNGIYCDAYGYVMAIQVFLTLRVFCMREFAMVWHYLSYDRDWFQPVVSQNGSKLEHIQSGRLEDYTQEHNILLTLTHAST